MAVVVFSSEHHFSMTGALVRPENDQKLLDSEPMDLEVHLTAHIAVQVVRQVEETAS